MAMFSLFSVLRRSGSQVFVGEPLQVVNPLRQTIDPAAPSIAARRCHASGAGEIGHIRRPMVVLPTEGNILAGHPVKGPRYIPDGMRRPVSAGCDTLPM